MSEAEAVEVPGIGQDPLEGATPEETAGNANHEDAVAGVAAGAVESAVEQELAEEAAEDDSEDDDSDGPDDSEERSLWSGLIWT